MVTDTVTALDSVTQKGFNVFPQLDPTYWDFVVPDGTYDLGTAIAYRTYKHIYVPKGTYRWQSVMTDNQYIQDIYCEPGTVVIFGENNIDARYIFASSATIYNMRAVLDYTDTSKGCFYGVKLLVNCDVEVSARAQANHKCFQLCNCLNCRAILQPNDSSSVGFNGCLHLTQCSVYSINSSDKLQERYGINFEGCMDLTQCGIGVYSSCTAITNCGSDGTATTLFMACNDITNCYGTFQGCLHVVGCFGKFTTCQHCIGNHGTFSNCYASNSATAAYACADTPNGGFNSAN